MNPNIDPAADIVAYNRAAWDSQVRKGNRWTVPVTPEEIERAREGDWSIVLTPEKPVPREWFPDFNGEPVEVLCLAGSGGQQAPILAAVGAKVTVFDNSPAQLSQDRMVAEREGLDIKLVQGDMADLSELADESFDLIVHPCSNCFVPNVLPVWKEASRVMKPGGNLLSGIVNPVVYLFDEQLMEKGSSKFVTRSPTRISPAFLISNGKPTSTMTRPFALVTLSRTNWAAKSKQDWSSPACSKTGGPNGPSRITSPPSLQPKQPS